MLRLVSKSPRRKEILEMVGIEFEVTLAEVEENAEANTPSEYVQKVAMKKGIDAVEKYPNDVILTADTIVVSNNTILEKPKNKEDAYQMIKQLQGNSHIVYTGVYIGCKNQNIYYNFFEATKVHVVPMSESEINQYISTKEPYHKAGAYAIQGIFGKYIERIEGDYFNVMGLPICSINEKLKKYKRI